MLKAKWLACCVAGVGLGAAGLAQAAEAEAKADGTLRFTGTVSANACTVSSTAGGSANAGTMNFGTVSTQTFDTAKKNTNLLAFDIVLTDCAVETAPRITFTGTPVTEANFTHLFSTGVSGIGIRISDAKDDSSYISGVPKTNSGLTDLKEKVTDAKAVFKTQLVSYLDESDTGEIDTTITFTLNYS